MDVPTYWDTDGSQESVCDPTRGHRSGASSYKAIEIDGYNFTFELTALGRYNILFYFMDSGNGIGYLRTTAVDDPTRPSVTQIVNNAVRNAASRPTAPNTPWRCGCTTGPSTNWTTTTA